MNIRQIIAIGMAFSAAILANANDGSFRSSGNHLIPMLENRIRVQKEILDIKMISPGNYSVKVYYEFFNPDSMRVLDVGFEAKSPFGVENRIRFERNEHPYIKDFTVSMNDKPLSVFAEMVNDSHYYKDGKFINLPEHEKMKIIWDGEFMSGESDFTYVYHFKARFKKGLNVIRHTYSYSGSRVNFCPYLFNYILSTANRWGNRQIDDFTLNIDMGNFRNFEIFPTFFKSGEEWTKTGIAKISDTVYSKYDENELDTLCIFFVRDGLISFHKMNFSPNDELYLRGRESVYYFDPFDHMKYEMSFDPESLNIDSNFVLSQSLKYLKNLPFARRGYISADKDIQSYFEQLDWYWPDPAFKAIEAVLTEEERHWLNSLKVK